MPSLPLTSWLLIGAVTFAGVVGTLLTLCYRLVREMAMHDIRVEMLRLQRQQEERLERIRRGEG